MQGQAVAGAGAVMRGARAVATTAVVTSLAAGAHAVGGGHLPSLLVLAALGSLVLLVVTVLARWQLRLWTLLPVLAGLQASIHGVLSFLSPGALSIVVNPSWSSGQLHRAMAHGGMVHGAMGSPLALVASSPVVHGPATPAMPAMVVGMPAMLLVHAAATLVTALVLVGADEAARRTICWLRAVQPLITSPTLGPIVSAGSVVAAAAFPGFVLVARGLVTSRPRRGPPLALATA
ncbi:MAG: hypothetical protein ACOH2F_09595 [Cellulomonas sp.]